MEQLSFYLPGVPVLLPDAPPVKERKPREPARLRFCDGCGERIKGAGWRPGDLCGACIPPGPAPPASRICTRRERCCPPGECKAIPF